MNFKNFDRKKYKDINMYDLLFKQRMKLNNKILVTEEAVDLLKKLITKILSTQQKNN